VEVTCLKLVIELAKYDLDLEGILEVRVGRVAPNQRRRRGCP
jgi:hypothetical protein